MPTSIEARTSPVEVIYADEAVVVVNKPSGLLSVPGRGPDKQDCASSRVQLQFSDALIVHRLDMATSGLMVMARGIENQRTLNHAFAQRLVQKRYIAEVSGVLPVQETWQEINLPIAADWPRRPLRMIDYLHGKPSLTRWRCIHNNTESNMSRLELEPVTGRSHQLRVHLQAIGYPIVGDGLYAPAQIQQLSHRLHLHACQLAFPHPLYGNMVELLSATNFETKPLKYESENHS